MKFNLQAAIKGAVVQATFNDRDATQGKVVFHKGNQAVVDFDKWGLKVVSETGVTRFNGQYSVCTIVPVVRYLNLYEDNTPAIFLSEELAKAAGEIKHKTKGFPIVVAQRIESEF